MKNLNKMLSLILSLALLLSPAGLFNKTYADGNVGGIPTVSEPFHKIIQLDTFSGQINYDKLEFINDDYFNLMTDRFIGTWRGTVTYKEGGEYKTEHLTIDMTSVHPEVKDDSRYNDNHKLGKYICIEGNKYYGNPPNLDDKHSFDMEYFIEQNKVGLYSKGKLCLGSIDPKSDPKSGTINAYVNDEDGKLFAKYELTKTPWKTIPYLEPLNINPQGISASQLPDNALIGYYRGEYAARLDAFSPYYNYYDVILDVYKQESTGKNDKGVDYISYKGKMTFSAREDRTVNYEQEARLTYYPEYGVFSIGSLPSQNIPQDLYNKHQVFNVGYGKIDASGKSLSAFREDVRRGYEIAHQANVVLNLHRVCESQLFKGNQTPVNHQANDNTPANSQHNNTPMIEEPHTIPEEPQVIPEKPHNNAKPTKKSGKANADLAALNFSDLPSNHWAYPFVQIMKDRGIISGFPDGTFKPNKTFSRAEFAKMLAVSYGLEPYQGNDVIFSDVQPDNWVYPYVMAANEIGAITYFEDDHGNKQFMPNDPSEREDVAVALVSLLGIDPSEADLSLIQGYNDYYQISDEVKPYVALAYELEIMQGDNNNNFTPHAPLTRAQACKVFAVVILILEELQE